MHSARNQMSTLQCEPLSHCGSGWGENARRGAQKQECRTDSGSAEEIWVGMGSDNI